MVCMYFTTVCMPVCIPVCTGLYGMYLEKTKPRLLNTYGFKCRTANAPADHLGRHLRPPPSGLCSIAKVRGALDGTADGPYLRGINLPRATLGGDERVDVLGRLLFPRRLGDEI